MAGYLEITIALLCGYFFFRAFEVFSRMYAGDSDPKVRVMGLIAVWICMVGFIGLAIGGFIFLIGWSSYFSQQLK